MHGIRRVKQSAEALAQKREKEREKLGAYLELEHRVLDLKDRDEYTQEALKSTLQLLSTNPEHYTVWNYRRNILVRGVFPDSTSEQVNDLLNADLAFTFAALKKHPKTYTIWNHRRWCLECIPDVPPSAGSDVDAERWRKEAWTQEIFIVEKLLDADARNFHAWDYRRYILHNCPASMRRSEADELKYTTHKIESNFSNFSAWHQRSLVYFQLWEANPAAKTAALDAEFELVKQALYIDPNDQSGWLYHRWLVGRGDDPAVLEREIGVITEILELEPDSKWCLESLVHYKRLLLRHRPKERREGLVAECKVMLECLKTIDPKRRMRYDAIVGELGVLSA